MVCGPSLMAIMLVAAGFALAALLGAMKASLRAQNKQQDQAELVQANAALALSLVLAALNLWSCLTIFTRHPVMAAANLGMAVLLVVFFIILSA